METITNISLVNLDHLVYPIMMQIRQLKDLQQDIQFKQHNCQNQVECLVLCLMRFTVDYIVLGPKQVEVSYCYERHKLRKELLLKLHHLQNYMSKLELTKLKRNMQEELENPEGFSETSSDNEELSFQIKLTGHLMEFSPEILRLNQKIKELTCKLHQHDEKESRRRNSVDQLAAAHIKEVQALKQQMRKLSQDEETHEYIEVVYFDKTSSLDSDIQEMMNEKIRNIKQQYDKYIHAAMQSRQLESAENNHKIKEEKVTKGIDAYTVKDLIRIAIDKEPNQYRIWKIIEELKSYRFLMAVITNQDKSYGIAYQEINELIKCNKQELKKIAEFKILMQDAQSSISAQYAIQIQQLKKLISEHSQQNLEIKQQLQPLLEFDQVQTYELTQEGLHKIVSQLTQKIVIYQNEINCQQDYITKLNIQLNQTQEQYRRLWINTTNVFKQLDFVAQFFVQLNRCDIYQEKPAIILDIKKKIENIQPSQCFLYSQYLSQLLHQSQAIEIVNEMEIRPQTKYTQTLPNDDEIKAFIMLSQLRKKNPEEKESHQFDQYTQTDSIQGKRIINKTEIYENFNQPVTFVDDQPFNSKSKFQMSTLDRLLGDSIQLNNRLKEMRPYIERLNNSEFKDLLQIFNTLRIEDSREIFQLDFSNIQLPQEQPPQAKQQRLSTLSVPQRLNNSKNVIRKPAKSIDSSIIRRKANTLFMDLEDKREEAQQLFMNTRISSFNNRLSRLIPMQLGEKIKYRQLTRIH